MITVNQFRTALVSRLKDSTRPEIATLLAALASGDEVRESQFQGTEYAYPALRVDVTYLNPTENIPCRDSIFRIYFSIICMSEDESSLEADNITGLVAEALDEAMLETADFRTGNISLGSTNSAIRIGPRLWRAEVFFRSSLYQKTS